MKLPKKYIKKYGITKKAWSMFKGSLRPKQKILKTKKVVIMARRRKRSYKRSNKRNNSFLGRLTVPLAGIAYGYLRTPIAKAVMSSGIGQKLPASQLTVPAVMIGLNYAIGMTGLGKSGIMKSVRNTAKSQEFGQIGAILYNTNMLTGTNSSSDTSLFNGGGF